MHNQCLRAALLGGTVLLAIVPAIAAQVQTAAPAVGPTDSDASSQGAAAIPNFSGIWTSPYFGFDPPSSGPGPVRGRRFRGRVVGDYTNPILKPQAAEAVKKAGEIELSGVDAPNPRTQCWPEGLPFVFINPALMIIQQPTQVTIFYEHDHQVRRVYLNQAHSVPVTPSWYGESVGHYEGETLVIDTLGFKMGPFSMSDPFGTPFTKALHVVERYSLIDRATAIEAHERGKKTHGFLAPETEGGLGIDPDYKGKGLRLEFTVEDQGVFASPYSAMATYQRANDWRGSQEWPELVCAENPHEYSGKSTALPRADKPDF